MSAIAEQAYSKIQTMPTELQQQALDFIDFLAIKNLDNNATVSDKTIKLQSIMQNIANHQVFDSITDPVAWQKQIRQDRDLPR